MKTDKEKLNERGVEAEYVYIASQCGQPYKDWKLQPQRRPELIKIRP